MRKREYNSVITSRQNEKPAKTKKTKRKLLPQKLILVRLSIQKIKIISAFILFSINYGETYS
jgi:hypothetical protein